MTPDPPVPCVHGFDSGQAVACESCGLNWLFVAAGLALAVLPIGATGVGPWCGVVAVPRLEILAVVELVRAVRVGLVAGALLVLLTFVGRFDVRVGVAGR